MVFDVTRLSTFEAVQMWKADLDNKVLLPNGKPIPAVLLANKVALPRPLSFITTLSLACSVTLPVRVSLATSTSWMTTAGTKGSTPGLRPQPRRTLASRRLPGH